MSQYRFNPKYNWWKEDHSANFLILSQALQGRKIEALEIGAFEGRSSVWILDNVISKESSLTVIEPYPEPGDNKDIAAVKDNLQYNLSLADPGQSRSRVIVGESKTILPRLLVEGRRFDLIYVDGDHNALGVLRDLIMAWDLLRVDGYMLMDDYEMETTDPWHFVSHKEFIEYPRIKFLHPKTAIDPFLVIYRGLYEKVIDNYQVGIKKIHDLE